MSQLRINNYELQIKKIEEKRWVNYELKKEEGKSITNGIIKSITN